MTWLHQFVGKFSSGVLLLGIGNHMYKTSEWTDAAVHSFYLLLIHSLPSSLPRAAVYSFYSLLSIFSCCPTSLAAHVHTLLCRWRAIPLSPFLPPSARYNLHVSMPPEWGRWRWLAASGTSPYLRTLFLALRPPWMTAHLRWGRWRRFESEVSLPPPSSCGSRSEPSSSSVDLDLSPPPSSSTFFNSAPPPPPTSPLGLDLRDVVVVKVSMSFWVSALAHVVMVFSVHFQVMLR